MSNRQESTRTDEYIGSPRKKKRTNFKRDACEGEKSYYKHDLLGYASLHLGHYLMILTLTLHKMMWFPCFHRFILPQIFTLQSFSPTYYAYPIFPEELLKKRRKTGLAVILDDVQKMFLVLEIQRGCCYKPCWMQAGEIK